MRKLSITVAVCCGLLAGVNEIYAQAGKGLIDLNTAPEEELAKLPHMKPAVAKGIVEQRPFNSIAAANKYLASQSLTSEQLTEFYRKAFVHVDLNKATAEEIMLIPGMTRRMLHEFEEYRPYKSMEQFRREIGKYVDDKEVARFEQYVFVPINLNTASDEIILSIPNLSRRMLREFKEYRPYKTMEQFRKEIGKYVDNKEVARLERCVTIE
jgi:DNA uptake protein ComE-like DNA-binding protein